MCFNCDGFDFFVIYTYLPVYLPKAVKSGIGLLPRHRDDIQ